MRRKTIVAAVAGLALIAAQGAAAASNSATARVGDRLGARTSGASQDFVGIPLLWLVGGIVFVGAVVAVASNDDGDSN